MMVVLIEKYYDLTYTIVSLVFLSPFAGYTLAAFTNNLMHVHFGQRGIAIISPLCHIVSFLVMAAHPPYPVLIIMFIFVGFGNGLADAAWCAWIGNMAHANEVSGFLQACYAIGATVAPIIATSIVSRGGLEWYSFYYIMFGGAALELATSTATFWTQTGAMYRAEHPPDPNTPNNRTREALKSKITWIFSGFIFSYMGAEISVGGWIVTFMFKVRNAPAVESSISATGFWAAMTVNAPFSSHPALKQLL
ncbi:hypothetical protein FJTKL_01682 [Diaporthe vaccinii]|uniref:Major facilitator superfamily (MFS) profile domain-containing protein n=2 Tax=Diaporthe vaccinii TaxID=105482 RepID=A0ABR4DZN6_9PEZI